METSSLMGMNVAKLVVNGWETKEGGKCSPKEVTEGAGKSQGEGGNEMTDKDL